MQIKHNAKKKNKNSRKLFTFECKEITLHVELTASHAEIYDIAYLAHIGATLCVQRPVQYYG